MLPGASGGPLRYKEAGLDGPLAQSSGALMFLCYIVYFFLKLVRYQFEAVFTSVSLSIYILWRRNGKQIGNGKKLRIKKMKVQGFNCNRLQHKFWTTAWCSTRGGGKVGHILNGGTE